MTTLKLYGHPFSSYTQKALMAFREKNVAFEFLELSPASPDAVEAHRALWPLAKFPVLEAGGRTIVEATSVIEWLDAHEAGDVSLIPSDPDAAIDVRMRDRIFDNYVMGPMQKIVLDRLRPQESRDAFGVAEARATLDRIYDWLDGEFAARTWIAGDAISLADCAAAPSLFYADWVHPFDGRDNLIAYSRRLRDRPSFAACVEGGRPTRPYFPGGAPKDRFED